MKKRTLFNLLIFSVAVSIASVVLDISFIDLLYFPFEKLGAILRFISLKGGLANIFALITYFILSLLPVLYLLTIYRKRILHKEDYLLIPISLFLFYTLYMVINPGLIPLVHGMAMYGSVGKAILCGSFYSLGIVYLIVKLIRMFWHSDTKNLYKLMHILLSIMGMFLISSMFSTDLKIFLGQTSLIKNNNIGYEEGLRVTYLFQGLKYILSGSTTAMTILVLVKGMDLVNELFLNSYSKKAVEESEKLTNLCKNVLLITVSIIAGFNILQLLFARYLRNIDGSLQLPIYNIIFLLGTLILSRMIVESKAFKDDGDSII